MIPWMDDPRAFPKVGRALAEPNGLLCAGGNLAEDTLITAYRQGIFPWFSEGQPILWWSPDPRMVLFPEEFKISRSLARTVKGGRFEIRFDSAFAQVIAGCAAPREPGGGTWIVPAMQEAYARLHRLGVAHSVESWRDGQLAGGLYGVALGRVFFGESMFTRETDASKVALVALLDKLRADGFRLIDCQQETRHLARFGARPIPRREFVRRLGELLNSAASQSNWT
ncbi:MAG TPA: leucyl/phenylalanyl-tRNA--protein transferase [Usitatibacteraceae bacterium]|nr:leucyl/phenylalanyl-tRNA--protein transferase [Usitatibacteraceae bacterium]